MRAVALVLLVALVACTPGADSADPPEPTDSASGSPGAVSELPAVDPPPPTRREFAREANQACIAAAAELRGAPLQRDPFVDRARRADVAAAEVHYRAAARAWTAMAERLWAFGLPATKKAQKLILQLDTTAQYSNQAAELFAEEDLVPAQNSIKWAAQALRRAEHLAADLGIRPLADCGRPPVRITGGRRTVITAADFSFRVPPLRRGATRFVLRNTGLEGHQLFVVRLRRPGTLDEALAADQRGDPPGRFLAGAGHTTRVVPPGARGTLDIRLRRGPYALLCPVASPDGTPHAYKGMAVEAAVR